MLNSLFTKQFWEATEYSEQQLVLMQETNCNNHYNVENHIRLIFVNFSIDLDVCKICLSKQGDLLHDLCLIRSKILYAAFDSAIQLQLWEAAAQYGILLIKAYKLWYGNEHPLTAILLLKLFKIFLLTSSSNDLVALNYYNEAVAIIELTHGKSSSFFRQEVKPLIQQLR